MTLPVVAVVVPHCCTACRRRCAAHCPADPCRHCVVRRRHRAVCCHSAPCHRHAAHRRSAPCHRLVARRRRCAARLVTCHLVCPAESCIQYKVLMQCTNVLTWELNRYRYLYLRGNSIGMDDGRQQRRGQMTHLKSFLLYDLKKGLTICHTGQIV